MPLTSKQKLNIIKMKKKSLLTISALGAVLISCSSTSYSYRSAAIPNKNIISSEVVVDLKLNLTKKVEAISTQRNSELEAKEEAYYLAITQNNIDVIVDPIYEITTSEKILFFGGKSVVKITGFGANYVNPRNKVEAINELNKTENSNINKFESIYPANEKESNTGFVPNFLKFNR